MSARRLAATLISACLCLPASGPKTFPLSFGIDQLIRTNPPDIMTAIRRDDRLKGKVAIVTGAGSRAEGIGNGRAPSVILARHGAQVTLVDNVAQWVDETKRLIDAEAGVSLIVEGDVGVPASCQAIVARTIEAWG